MDHSSRWEIDTARQDISNLYSRNGRRSLDREVNAGNCKRTTGTHHHTLKFGVFGRAVSALLAAEVFRASSLPPGRRTTRPRAGGGKGRPGGARVKASTPRPQDTTGTKV